MKNLVGSPVIFVQDDTPLKGTVRGFHNNLGMFKIIGENGRDYLVEPESVLFGSDSILEKPVVGSVVKILPEHLKDNLGLGVGSYVYDKLGITSLFGVVSGLYKEGGRVVAKIINITENKTPDIDNNTYKSEFVYLDNISVCTEEVDLTESEENIEEGDEVLIKPSFLDSNQILGSSLPNLIKQGVVVGTALQLDHSDGTVYVAHLYNRETRQMLSVPCLWVCLENLEKVQKPEEDNLDDKEEEAHVEENDLVVVRSSNLVSDLEVNEDLMDLVREENLAGIVERIDSSDNTALVGSLYNLSTHQRISRSQNEQWIELEDLKKLDAQGKNDNAVLNLITLINKWGTDRNITLEGGTTPQKQVSKLVEEVAECIEALDDVALKVDGAEDKLKDAYGDMLVCIIQAIRLSGMDFTDCLNAAYNEIKDRKGTMVNGKFVKES